MRGPIALADEFLPERNIFVGNVERERLDSGLARNDLAQCRRLGATVIEHARASRQGDLVHQYIGLMFGPIYGAAVDDFIKLIVLVALQIDRVLLFIVLG